MDEIHLRFLTFIQTDDFVISLNKIYSISVRIDTVAFNRGKVKPSDELVCRDGVRLFDRFFYVSKGVIHFDLPNGEQLTAKSGDIVYLPNNCCYVCHWNKEPVGEHYTIAFVLFNSKNEPSPIEDKIEIALSDTHGKYLDFAKTLCEIWFHGEFGYMLKCRSVLLDFLYNIAVDIEKKSKNNGIYKQSVFIFAKQLYNRCFARLSCRALQYEYDSFSQEFCRGYRHFPRKIQKPSSYGKGGNAFKNR